MAYLLSDNRVQRPYNWFVSFPVEEFGSGQNPVLRVIEWVDQTDYEIDLEAGNTDHGAFVTVEVPGMALGSLNDTSAILTALQGLGGAYDGVSSI